MQQQGTSPDPIDSDGLHVPLSKMYIHSNQEEREQEQEQEGGECAKSEKEVEGGRDAGLDSNWSREEDIKFETALAVYGDETPERWENVASMVGARTPDEVKERYDILVKDVNSIECDQVLTLSSTPDMAKEADWGSQGK